MIESHTINSIKHWTFICALFPLWKTCYCAENFLLEAFTSFILENADHLAISHGVDPCANWLVNRQAMVMSETAPTGHVPKIASSSNIFFHPLSVGEGQITLTIMMRDVPPPLCFPPVLPPTNTCTTYLVPPSLSQSRKYVTCWDCSQHAPYFLLCLKSPSRGLKNLHGGMSLVNGQDHHVLVSI